MAHGVTQEQLDALDDGLVAAYYADNGPGDGTVSGLPVVVRNDPVVGAEWGLVSPDPALDDGDPDQNQFHAGWWGTLTAPETGKYNLVPTHDSGLWVDVDGVEEYGKRANVTEPKMKWTVNLVAGQQYQVQAIYWNYNREAHLDLAWQRPPVGYEELPGSLLSPVTYLAPMASIVSPAFTEGAAGQPVGLSALVDGVPLAVNSLSDTNYFVDVPLDPAVPVVVAVDDGGHQIDAAITWTSIPVDGDEIVLRAGSSLLFAAPAGHGLRVGYSCGTEPDQVFAADGLLAQSFADAGYYTVDEVDGTGAVVGSRSVVAVTTDLAERRFVAEVGFAKTAAVAVTPHVDHVSWGVSSELDADLAVAGQTTTSVAMSARPLRRGVPRLIARLGGGDGPVLATCEVEEFTFESTARGQLHADPVTMLITPAPRLTMR
ncbi:MAG: PA14 domain-containing protein, partial [Planctomycetota bacterium]